MTKRRIFLGGLRIVKDLLLALAAAAPRRPGYWLALGVLIWWAAPRFGATSLTAMVARHAVLFGAIIVGVPFAFSSPAHPAFWVVFGALAFILMPLFGALGWFYGDIRRVLRERASESDRAG